MRAIHEERATHIVGRVLDELDGRGGFDHWWGSLDESIRDDIDDELISIVTKLLVGWYQIE